MCANGRWILDWQDRTGDPDRRIIISADSVEELRESVHRMLTGLTWTPDGASDTEPLPAITGFLQEACDLNDDTQALHLWSPIKFECDDGVLLVVRER